MSLAMMTPTRPTQDMPPWVAAYKTRWRRVPRLLPAVKAILSRPVTVDSTIGGGRLNNIAGSQNGSGFSTISGGDQNSIQTNGAYSTIGGGSQNTIQTNAPYSVIGGGNNNVIKSPSAYATVAGGAYNTAIGSGTTVGGGYGNTSIASSNYYYATVGGGNGNTANGYTATVGGGGGNSAILDDATVAGGGFNTSSNFAATVGGGFANKSTGDSATIAGGGFNNSSGDHATIGGGEQNTSSGSFATVGGGIVNYGTGYGATVPGGQGNNAAGDYSFAAGLGALANHRGAFVWSDSSNFLASFSSTTSNQFNVRATGGVRFVTGGGGMTLDGTNVALRAGGNNFTSQQTIISGDAAQLILQNSNDGKSWYVYNENFGGSGALIFQPSPESAPTFPGSMAVIT